jgi:hypothetical protein
MEELGKVSQAVVRAELNGKESYYEDAGRFLLSVVGVCVSTLEAMDCNSRVCRYCDNREDDPKDQDCPENCPVLVVEKKLAGSE